MILMYHHVVPQGEPSADGTLLHGWRFNHTPEAFEFQLRDLRRRGYRLVSLDTLVEEIQLHGSEPPKTVAITFDDGWLNNFTHAFPILQALAVPATFFCTTGHLHTGPPEPDKMTPSQLRELIAAGMTIGGHTRSHPDLTSLPLELARAEIAGCRQDLAQTLGVDIRFFAYPGGAFNRDIERITREAGYTAACSVLGPARNDLSSMFWLYRDILSESMDTWGDRYRLCPAARRLLEFRVRRRLRQKLI